MTRYAILMRGTPTSGASYPEWTPFRNHWCVCDVGFKYILTEQEAFISLPACRSFWTNYEWKIVKIIL